jgi:hypothetical protein
MGAVGGEEYYFCRVTKLSTTGNDLRERGNGNSVQVLFIEYEANCVIGENEISYEKIKIICQYTQQMYLI